MIKILAKIGLIFLFAAQVSAQYRFDVWTIDDGLPQNSVNDIRQTRDGYLWLTTNGGLVRYDGVRFKVFDSGNTKGLKGTRFQKLFEDRDGVLWITTESNGLVKYKAGVFSTYTTAEGLPNNLITETRRQEPDGTIEFLADGNFIVKMNDEKVVSVISDYLEKPRPRWFLDSNGLNILKDEKVENIIPTDGSRPAELMEVFQKYFGYVVSDKNKSKKLLDMKRSTKFDYAVGSFVTDAVTDRRGDRWFNSEGAGLFRVSRGRIYNYTTESGLPSDEISKIYEDREGNIWAGTSRGLVRITEKVISAYSKTDGLANDNTYPIFQDSKDTIWIGTWAGLTKFENGVFTDVGTEYNLKGDLLRSFYEDREGNFWVGTFGGDGDSGGVRKFSGGKFVSDFKNEIPFDTEINAIFQDRAGAMWFGTNKGLYKFENGVFTNFRKKDGLAGEIVFVIHEDRRGSLWFGTESGLTELKDGAFRTFDEKDGLSGYIMRSIYEDADGILWFGTYDGGLNRYKDGKFTSYTTGNGLFNNGVFQILEDRRGEFWISSNLGIYRVNRRELNDFADGVINHITSVSYGKPDGMLDVECNGGGQPAGIKAKDGKFWFPTQKGVVVFNPDDIKIINTPPPVKIEDVLVDNVSTAFDEEIKIPSDKENFQISYTGLSFILPEQIRFRYKLEGLNDHWTEAGTRRTAYFSYLPPGEYNFVVTAANRDGVWNPNAVNLKIIIEPAVYQTWWFRLLAVLIAVGIIFALYQRRVNALRQANETQKEFSKRLIESQETERKRIAAELHDSLSQNLVVIKNRVLLAKRTIEDREKTTEQLEEISSATEEAIDEVTEISYNLRPYQLDKLGLTKAVESMLKKISTASGIKFKVDIDKIDDFFPPDLEINFYRIVQECANNIVKHSEADEAEIKITRLNPKLRLMIRDNGRGFQPDRIETSRQSGGFGLIGLAERTRILGGKYQVQSSPNEGTTVTLEITATESIYGNGNQNFNR